MTAEPDAPARLFSVGGAPAPAFDAAATGSGDDSVASPPQAAEQHHIIQPAQTIQSLALMTVFLRFARADEPSALFGR
jgi:hypothetical protein